MNLLALAPVVLAEGAEGTTKLPMEIVGWGTLAVGLLVTIVWLAYLYR